MLTQLLSASSRRAPIHASIRRGLASGATESPVLIEKRGNTMSVTLNRPKALNSLNLEMVRILTPLYTKALFQWQGFLQDLEGELHAFLDIYRIPSNSSKQWDTDETISNIVLRGQGRAFCAGGDIVEIYDSGKNGTPLCKDFFREEYILNQRIGTLTTPHVAIISVGGGVGLSVHGRFRVATETTLFAMPETGIGFFPDVGGSYFLPRLQGYLGMYLGLTGHKLKGQHVAAAGIATHYVPSERIGELEKELESVATKNADLVEATINKYAVPAHWGDSEIKASMDIINSAFSKDTVEGIITSLQEFPDNEFAKKTLATLAKVSPTSLKVTHKLLTLGNNLTFEECFEMEYNVSQQCMKATDFYEGVAELLVTKTNNPHWSPDNLADVKDEDVDLYFRQVHELRFGKNREGPKVPTSRL